MNDSLNFEILSYRALAQSQRVIQNIHDFYFAIYGLSSDFLLQHYPILVFTEAFVYRLDTITEQMQDMGDDSVQIYTIFSPLQRVLESQKLWDESIASELCNLIKYYQFESEIMLNAQCNRQQLDDTNALRSSDLRLLHRLVCKLASVSYDEAIFQVLNPIEILFEIEDDIYSYESDVKKNRFNTLSILKSLEGKGAMTTLLEMTAALEEQFRVSISELSTKNGALILDLFTAFRTKFPPLNIEKINTLV